MYRKLNSKEREKFTNKYLPEWKSDIKEVSMLTYRLTKEYLINGHYLVIVKSFRIIHKDLQEI